MVQNRYTLCETVGNPSDWRYTWDIRDDVSFSSHCAFCGRDGRRLTYEVRRDERTARICDYCVSRYTIAADIAGEKLGPKAARDYVHGLTTRLQQQTCYDIIRRAQAEVAQAALEEVAVYFDRNVQLSPLHAARLFAALSQMGEPDTARVFEIQTRSKAHQQEFGDLDDRERNLVWIALSPQQRRRMTAMGSHHLAR